jgi:quinol monooxygenase YgiN
MDDPVRWVMEFAVKPGQLDTLTHLVAEMAQSTRAEPGALEFTWSVRDDGTGGQVYERYADTAAALAHLRTFTERFAEQVLAAVAPTRFTVLGLPSDGVRQALAGFAPTYLRPMGGFVRDIA